MMNKEQNPESCQIDVSSSYLPLTLLRIIEIVDQTKDLTEEEQTKIAYLMPMTACGLYVLNMKSRHNISVSI